MMMLFKNTLALGLLLAVAGCETDDTARTSDPDADDSTDLRVGAGDVRSGGDIDVHNGTRSLSQGDREFVSSAAVGGMFEVQSSQLALQQSLDPQLQRIARMMIDDHSRVNQELTSLAARKGFTVPRNLDAEHQNRVQQLQNTSSNQFASQYYDQQVRAHEDAIALFDRAANDVQDAEIRSFAQRHLPTLREHLNHLRQYVPVDSGTAIPSGGMNPPVRDQNLPSNPNDTPDRQDLPPRNVPH